jgi:acetyltransferase-like isoleucine patch superfamily enzyme
VLRTATKRLLWGASLLVALPFAATAAFGRIKTLFTVSAHLFALAPGIVGDYLRIAFYKLTVTECSLASRISFGSFFAHPEVRIAPGVYIGSYCIIGKVAIGARTQIASGVQVLSGRHQHLRTPGGGISGAEHGHFEAVSIGEDCWIGAGAIVMADVGAASTVGAGAVVTKPFPPGSTAVGIPARAIDVKTSEIAR